MSDTDPPRSGEDHGGGTARPHSASPAPPEVRVDRRSLRRSGRTVQLATRVTPDFHERVRRIARYEGLLHVEVLEWALDALEERRRQVLKRPSGC
jgi:hypothetical protein